MFSCYIPSRTTQAGWDEYDVDDPAGPEATGADGARRYSRLPAETSWPATPASIHCCPVTRISGEKKKTQETENQAQSYICG